MQHFAERKTNVSEKLLPKRLQKNAKLYSRYQTYVIKCNYLKKDIDKGSYLLQSCSVLRHKLCLSYCSVFISNSWFNYSYLNKHRNVSLKVVDRSLCKYVIRNDLCATKGIKNTVFLLYKKSIAENNALMYNNESGFYE